MSATDFKTAIRNIKGNKVQSIISILGLGIGLGCIIVLLALILHETSFDRFIPAHKNVYRIMFGESSSTQYPLAEEMKNEFPEVTDYFRFYQENDFQLRDFENKLVKDKNFGFADPSVYKILGIRLIAGTPASSVSEVTVSEKTAFKYFGKRSPLGAILSVKLNEEFVDLSICGIYKDFPSTSTLYPQFIANIKLSEKMFRQYQRTLGAYGSENRSALNWENGSFSSYVVLDKNTDKEALAGKMNKYKVLLNNEKVKDFKYSFQPVADIYLRSGASGASIFIRSGNPNELKYYEAISILILLISITNYIFLTRAGMSNRLSELGIRKVFGASRRILRNQIILESNIITLLSLIPAAFVINSGMLFINRTLEKSLNIDIFSNPVMWLLLLLVLFFTGTISGLLIGFNISRIPSLLLLSGKSSARRLSGKWDYSFLVFHFSIYVILVVSVMTVSKQIRYSLTNFKGINPNNIIISDLNSTGLKNSFSAICDEMRKIPGVVSVAGSSFIPPLGAYLPINLATPDGEKVRFDGLIMGEGMTEMLGIEVIDGETFDKYKTDRIEVLFNESSALKYKVKAGDLYLGFNVKGIVKDFHAHSLHTLIQPMVILQQNPDKMSLLAIKTDGSNDKVVIKQLSDLYKEISPNEIFEVTYLTDQIRSFYGNERNQGKIIGAFSLLATVLSIMGLFGIALISISKKTKEIGIRKVNGASIGSILYMLNIAFVKWVLIAIAISIPASVYLISEWQNRFAYKTELSWWIFAAAGISSIFIALITVSWQSWKAATRNPVEALRYE
jgi:putative ABC transport system permease protein